MEPLDAKCLMPDAKPLFAETITRSDTTTLVKLTLFVGVLGHTAYLIAGLFLGYLGANPVEAITHITGNWALYFLMATLAVTPVRKLLKWKAAAKLRRALGLWSFYYLLLHFLTYITFDHFFSLESIIDDVIKRPYITVGFLAFLIMLPLAATSFKRAIKILGKRWQLLHRSVYLVAILAIIHYLWLVKADITQPIIYGAIVGFLLGLRCYWWQKKKA